LFLSFFSRNRSFTTPVEPATPHPIWTHKHVFSNLDREEVYEGQVEVTLWNFSHTVKHECVGELDEEGVFKVNFSCKSFSQDISHTGGIISSCDFSLASSQAPKSEY
jgi:hypothetical protein